MLPQYDARAIADVLGLSFVRLPRETARVVPGAQSARRPGKLRRGADAGVEFPLVNGDGTVVLMQVTTTEGGATTRSDPMSPREVLDESRTSPSSSLIEKAVESGLPRTSLRHVAESITGGDRAKVAALEWGIVPKTTLDRRDLKLSIPESERTERIARLFVHARRALGTEAEARDFMMMPHPELDGRSPVANTRTDLGTRRVERLLTALEYGLSL